MTSDKYQRDLGVALCLRFFLAFERNNTFRLYNIISVMLCISCKSDKEIFGRYGQDNKKKWKEKVVTVQDTLAEE